MKITQCLHTAIIVSDLDKAAHFYGHILGLSPVNRQLNFPGIWYQLDNYQIHLMTHPQAKGKLYNMEKWGRNAHIALSVDHLNRAIARLTQYNCPMQMSSSGRPALYSFPFA
jgi:catechol 2,3-dioxygenase-like lactoylglutathione lyase family enzyme